MTGYLLAIDQGTSSCRAIVFNDAGGVEVVFQREFGLVCPQTGWVEQNPQDILDGTLWALRGCAEYCKDKGIKIAAAGITNQRETTIIWDRKTGEPIYNAIVWQDRRTADFCATLRRDISDKEIAQKTGLLLDPYFSATKIRWILNNVKDARLKAERGELCFGTVDSFLIWHLTQQKNHVTDLANASRTMILDIVNKNWDHRLLKIFDIPLSILPKISPNISNFGQLIEGIFDHKISILGVVGDQQSAMIGQGCITLGMMKSTYGTGCFALMNIGSQFKTSDNRLLTTIGYDDGDDLIYALEGSIFNAGTAIQFLRDNLGIISKAKETQDLAYSVPDNGGVYFVPALTGLGAPYWKPEAKGLISGLDRNTSKAHLARAALEAQAYQTMDLISAMEQDSGQNIPSLRADGGLVANEFMCQFLADITQRQIDIPAVAEATAWGAACLAGVGASIYKDLAETAKLWKSARGYEPKRSTDEVEFMYSGWKKAVAKTLM